MKKIIYLLFILILIGNVSALDVECGESYTHEYTINNESKSTTVYCKQSQESNQEGENSNMNSALSCGNMECPDIPACPSAPACNLTCPEEKTDYSTLIIIESIMIFLLMALCIFLFLNRKERKEGSKEKKLELDNKEIIKKQKELDLELKKSLDKQKEYKEKKTELDLIIKLNNKQKIKDFMKDLIDEGLKENQIPELEKKLIEKGWSKELIEESLEYCKELLSQK